MACTNPSNHWTWWLKQENLPRGPDWCDQLLWMSRRVGQTPVHWFQEPLRTNHDYKSERDASCNCLTKDEDSVVHCGCPEPSRCWWQWTAHPPVSNVWVIQLRRFKVNNNTIMLASSNQQNLVKCKNYSHTEIKCSVSPSPPLRGS